MLTNQRVWINMIHEQRELGDLRGFIWLVVLNMTFTFYKKYGMYLGCHPFH